MRRAYWAFGAFGWTVSAVKIATLFGSVNLLYAAMGCIACLLIALLLVIRAIKNKPLGDWA